MDGEIVARKTKYQPLADYLADSGQNDVTLSFSQIEEILGFKLSPSARKHKPNWANNTVEALSWGWMPVGYESYGIDMKNEIAHFRKISSVNTSYVHEKVQKVKKTRTSKTHATNGIIISNDLIEEAHKQVKTTKNYGKEDDLITDCFKRFPLNNDVTMEKPNDWDINESVFSIRPNLNRVTASFMYMTFTDETFVKKASSMSTGSIFKGIRISELLNIQI